VSEIRTTIVFTTASSREEGDRIASALVEEHLAACVNLVPVASVYRWQGAVERADEVLLVIKTRRALVPRLGARVRALHSYQLPEVVAVPIAAGSRQYLSWLVAETRGAARPRRRATRPVRRGAPTGTASPRRRSRP